MVKSSHMNYCCRRIAKECHGPHLHFTNLIARRTNKFAQAICPRGFTSLGSLEPGILTYKAGRLYCTGQWHLELNCKVITLIFLKSIFLCLRIMQMFLKLLVGGESECWKKLLHYTEGMRRGKWIFMHAFLPAWVKGKYSKHSSDSKIHRFWSPNQLPFKSVNRYQQECNQTSDYSYYLYTK